VTLMKVQSVKTDGTPPTFDPVTATDTMPYSPESTLIVRNASPDPVDVTLVTPGNLGTGDQYPDKVVTCDPGSGTTNEVPTEVWIPISKDYVDPGTGQITVNYSAQTDVSSALVAL
jgi:hypothetical protein